MNILEMEDMVKGLPDQVLMQYAQFPDPQLPQFLALSEVQRRQDMRQRFQSQQQGMEPTVKDKILQGGIASVAPPQAPPQGMPMAQPQPAPQPPVAMSRGGMTPGGIVSMQEGRTVPNEGAGARRARIAAELRAARASNAPQEVIDELTRQLDFGLFTPAGTLSRGAAAQAAIANQPMFESMGIAPVMEQFDVSVDQPEFDLSLPVVPAATQRPAATTQTDEVDEGIASLNQRPPANIPVVDRSMESEAISMIKGLRGKQERAPEVTEYLDLLRQQREAGLPPPVDVSEFVTRAEERGRTAREEARRQALGAALLQLGGGLAAGDLAAGLRGAGTQAAEIMGQGRKEAAQQTALAEQLRMRGAESQRQAQVEALQLQREATKAIADVATSERASDADREQVAAKLFSDFVTALENRRSELAQQGRLDARNFATTATNLFENMVAPLTGIETPEQLAQREQALQKATILAANMLGIDPGPVVQSLRASSPVVVEHKGKRYQFPNQQAADEFKQRMGS